MGIIKNCEAIVGSLQTWKGDDALVKVGVELA